MNLTQASADLFIPDAETDARALGRTTHLGIGAHQDDLEFMALHGILQCFQRKDCWFGGITCTNGSGSPRTGPYTHFTDEAMQAVRSKEQRTAASIGDYSFIAQLGHPSQTAKHAKRRAALVEDITQILRATRPTVVYTHNPFDKHATHIGVLLATLAAIQALPDSQRPKELIGCEVWRGLDWLPDSEKLIHDVSAHPNLAAALNGVYDSQISGGKRYDLAVEGRRRANATFLDAHNSDELTQVHYALDMSQLIHGDGSLEAYIRPIVEGFQHELFSALE
ncbi:MAG: PIG-L family deacetylase [Puniceicoccaceae bacterium]|nr:MAG: PIG-L family deacetylase [Puniceicoccaceae bacterium]